jgi:hypothetical protein
MLVRRTRVSADYAASPQKSIERDRPSYLDSCACMKLLEKSRITLLASEDQDHTDCKECGERYFQGTARSN